MKFITVSLLFACLLPCYAIRAQKTVYDANAQVRQVGTFNSVSVSSAIDLYITMGNEEAVAVSIAGSAKEASDAITTEVRNGTLYIGYKKGGSTWGAKTMKAYVSIKSINQLQASGASDVYVDGTLQATDLAIILSGASDFKGQVKVENLKLSASGSSDFTITGTAVNTKIDLQGSSDVKGFDLITDNCSIDASGSSDVHITVNKQLKATCSGSSDVRYKGEPTVKEVRTSGASDVRKV